MNKTHTMSKIDLFLLAKHHEFEVLAARMRDSRRCIAKGPRGVDQHVVEGKNCVLRWPTSYDSSVAVAHQEPPRKKVRYEPLPVPY